MQTRQERFAHDRITGTGAKLKKHIRDTDCTQVAVSLRDQDGFEADSIQTSKAAALRSIRTRAQYQWTLDQDTMSQTYWLYIERKLRKSCRPRPPSAES